MSAQVVEDEDYQLRYEIVAGIDVAKESAVVCVRRPPAKGKKHRTSHPQTVPATVPAIGKLAAELKAAGVQMVSMEATSDYWRIWFAVLEEAGLAVRLVNSSQARNLPGRPKTDKEDARWIARLTETGMPRSSFVPPPEIRALRVCTRHIWDLTADRTRYWQRLEKLPEDALCKLPAAVSKLAGHQTARAVIEAMIAGERDPRILAAPGQGKMRNDKLPALAEALSGMRFGPQHASAAASLPRAIDLLEAELRDLEEQVAAHLAAIPASWGADADGVTGPEAGRAGDAAALPAADRPDEIPGLGKEAAAALTAGIGLDMSRFPTPEALVSRAGLTPTARQSGPRQNRGKKGHGNTYAKRIPVLAAYAAANTDTFPGERFRRLASRPGGGGRKKAGCAAGRSILVIVWHLLNDRAARYHDLGPDRHARHTDRNRKARNAQRQ
ncbi:MAG TPA: IS110 family transposase, partial [Streptosporangiaceae bacterium]|nr:IS110 family transposase [Streptosporangiaceae bacterium]